MPHRLDFEWPSFRVALEGRSYLDVPKLALENKNDAKLFLKSYGYDIDDPLIREEIWRIYFESLSFIKNHLLDPGEKIPTEFFMRGNHSEILRLLTEASKRSSDRGRWACSILRVMHIVSHLDNDVRIENFGHAREQIFTSMDSHITSVGGRRWRFGGKEMGIPLVRYIKKERKERPSILMKLLSRPTNVVEEIYDSLGFRFVTETRFDAYRLIHQLFRSGAVSPANIQPGRSVNTLIPLDIFKQTIDETRELLDRGELGPKTLAKALKKIEDETLVSWSLVRNPNTSRWYRAIQFTCRHLVVAPDPTYRFWSEIKPELEKAKNAATLLKKIPITLRERRTFYYPYEIQILDKDSYVESIGGRSRHREYKAKQRLMARNRVLRDLI